MKNAKQLSHSGCIIIIIIKVKKYYRYLLLYKYNRLQLIVFDEIISPHILAPNDKDYFNKTSNKMEALNSSRWSDFLKSKDCLSDLWF